MIIKPVTWHTKWSLNIQLVLVRTIGLNISCCRFKLDGLNSRLNCNLVVWVNSLNVSAEVKRAIHMHKLITVFNYLTSLWSMLELKWNMNTRLYVGSGTTYCQFDALSFTILWSSKVQRIISHKRSTGILLDIMYTRRVTLRCYIR